MHELSTDKHLEKRGGTYDAPLGDKVAFSLYRADANSANYTEVEKIAIQVILEEQYRKRALKRKQELMFTNRLKLKDYLTEFNQLLVYLNTVYMEHLRTDSSCGVIIATKLEELDLPENISSCLVNLFNDTGKYKLNDQNLFKQDTVNYILSEILSDICIRHSLPELRKMLSLFEILSNDEYYDRLIRLFLVPVKNGIIKNFSPREANNSAAETYLDYRFRNSGLCFSDIIKQLREKDSNFTYGSSQKIFYWDCSLYTYQKIINVHWGDERFYLHEQDPTACIKLYKKYRLPGDEPWEGHGDFTETDFEYILDRRRIFIKRFAYRVIRPEQRMLLAHSATIDYLINIYPRDWREPFDQIEGNTSNNKYLIKHNEADMSVALKEEVCEFSLNRLGTTRFRCIATSLSAHKYDLRSNKLELFYRPTNTFDDIKHMSGNMKWQGGGVIKIDLACVEQNDVRAQYKSKSRKNMDRVKAYIQGMKSQEDDESVSEEEQQEQQKQNLLRELEEAKKSAVRNREVHLSKLPVKSICGWKPFSQFPIWLSSKDITMPLIKNKEYFFRTYNIVCSPDGCVFPQYTLNSTFFNPNPGKSLREVIKFTKNRYSGVYKKPSDVNCEYDFFLEKLSEKLEDLGADKKKNLLLAIDLNTNFLSKYLSNFNNENILALALATVVAVVKYLRDNPNTPISINEMNEALGVPINHAIAHCIQSSQNDYSYSDSISMAFFMNPKKTTTRPEDFTNSHDVKQISASAASPAP